MTKKISYASSGVKYELLDPIKKLAQQKAYIINIYKTILLRGIKGAYVYVCDDALREYFKDHIDLYKNITKEEVYNILEYPKAYEMISLPVFESVGCGDPLYADATAQDSVMVRKDFLVSGAKYFVLKVSGDSMNKAGINDGDLVLCKKNYHPQNGDNVVALIGDDATIKKYYQEKGFIVLKPCSANPKHKEMRFVGNGDEVKIQAVVVRVLH
jgi:repressor LexA